MTTMTYLQPKCTKGFVVRSNTVAAAMTAVTGTIIEADGKLVFESPLTKSSTFCLVSFENETKLLTWEAIFLTTVKQRVQDAQKVDVPIKILRIKDDTQNEHQVIETIKEMCSIVSFYAGTILRTRRVAKATYDVIVFFADSERADEFQKIFDIQNS